MSTSVANPSPVRDTSADVTSRGLPDAVHDLIEYETACAYADGWRAALEAVAAGQVELDETWHETGRRGYEQRVAERLSLFERCAARLAEQMGRPGYQWRGTQRTGGVRDELQERRQAA